MCACSPQKKNAALAKQALRLSVRSRMDQMTPEEAAASSRSITDAVLSSPLYQKAGSVFLYVSIGKEPDTWKILRHALAHGKKVYVPKCLPDRGMLAVRIQDTAALQPGLMGIPEPREWTETANARQVDLIIVPCMAAGRDGSRLGHGGGYYDRFLQHSDTPTLCLCHRALLCGAIPMEPRDVRMDQVICGEE